MNDPMIFMKAMFPGFVSAGDAPGHGPGVPLLEQFDDLHQTWKESIEKWAALVKEGSSPVSLTPEALQSLFTPAQWSGPGAGLFDASLQRALEGPRYATLWDLDRQLLELQQSALRRDKAMAAYQAIVQRAWGEAAQRFSKSVSSSEADVPRTWRGLTDRWLAIANDTLIEAHRSNELIEAQSRMLRLASDHRLQERRLAEAWCEACHIPTRSEMDEMQRTVTELKRELRLLKRQSRPAADPQPTARAPSRKTAAKPRRLATA